MSRARLFLALVALAIALWPGDAVATPNFPNAIKTRLGATNAPDCSICHVCGVTGRGTVRTPWGSSMRSRGLVAYDESSLNAALSAMATDRVDSDGDGMIDVDAVRMGLSPNPSSNCEADDPTMPAYGCVGRVAPSNGDSRAAIVLAVMVVLTVLRRRRVGSTGALVFVLLGTTALSACQSGANLAPRDELFQSTRIPAPPRMAPLSPTKLAADLAKLGLDARHLPPFAALGPRQRRELMSTFTRSLGYACTDCHDSASYLLRTRAMTVTIHMWNEMTAPYAMSDGAGVYCDSCHQGQGKFLDRRDKAVVATYMEENYTDRIARVGARGTIGCSDCHGSPMDLVILAKWL